jgi:hypothetical protein
MDASIFLPFDDFEDDLVPRDDAEGLDEIVPDGPTTGLQQPPVIDGVFGPARLFGGAAAFAGYIASDRVPGSTLHQRNVTIQSILTWDIDNASALAPGTIIARGTGASVAERMAYGLEVRLVDLTAQIGEVRWLWHDSAGALKTQIGGHFQARAAFMMLTATRRWVSSSEVILRYFLGDELLVEVPSTDGSIAGGTTATTAIGTRYTGAVYENFYAGKIDQLRVIPRELTREEIAGTARRIFVTQPATTRLYLEMHDPGFPMPTDPASRVMREARQIGHGLGYAAAQADNLQNILPDRAYGEALDRWEAMTRQSPRPNDSVERRRARVIGRLSHRAGASVEGTTQSIGELAATATENLEILAFSPTTEDATGDDFTDLRWWKDPAAAWSIASDALRVQNAGVNARFTGSVREWYTARQSIAANAPAPGGRASAMFAKVAITSTGNGSDVGIAIGDMARGNLMMLFLRKPSGGGDLEITSERFLAYVSQGVTTHATTAATTAWLVLRVQAEPLDGTTLIQTTSFKFVAMWSTTAADGPFTSVADIDSEFLIADWAMLFHRTIPGSTPVVDASFDDVRVRAPFGDRAFHGYIYRDPGYVGRPDAEAIRATLREMSQAHTTVNFTEAKVALYDDPYSVYGITPLGSI